MPDYDGAYEHAILRLEGELAAELTYHSPGHTRDQVVPAAQLLAALEHIDDESWRLLRIGAAYHDIGFVEQLDDHEAASMRIARSTLPRFGFSDDQIVLIEGMILATKLPQAPRTLLEMIIADADLEVLGQDVFMAHNQALRDELVVRGQPMTDAEWYGRQVRFVATHTFFTASARRLRDAAKQRNLALLEARLADALAAGGGLRP